MPEENMPVSGQPELSRSDAVKVDFYFWLQAAVTALVTLILVFTFFGRIIGVVGTSMVPTLHNGDILLLQSIHYTPKQGDVVVLSKPSFIDGEPIVKRVIATGGQTVDIDYQTSTVYVDGNPLSEPYLNESFMLDLGSNYLTHADVPEGSIFVMGDNRNASSDSRHPNLGVVDDRYVLGHALTVLLPFPDFGIIK